MKNLTIANMAQILKVEKDEVYGMVRFLEAKGILVKSGKVKGEPGKRGRSEHLYRIDVDTPSLVALQLDALLDASVLSEVAPALVTEGEAQSEVPALDMPFAESEQTESSELLSSHFEIVTVTD